MSSKLAPLLNEIRDDTENGAATLTNRALDVFAQFAESIPETGWDETGAFRRLVVRVHDLRPSMGAIGVMALLVYDRVVSRPATRDRPLKSAVREAVSFYRALMGEADARISAVAVDILGERRVIATCSYSSTLMSAFRCLSPSKIMVGDGAPLNDGVRTAEALCKRDINVTLAPDGAIPSLAEQADVVVLGADQILLSGAVINRAGSFPLALAASHYGIPVYILCHSIKVSGIADDDATIERLSADGFRYPAGIDVDVPLFDVTPASLISGVISENGLLKRNDIEVLSYRLSDIRRNMILCVQ